MHTAPAIGRDNVSLMEKLLEEIESAAASGLSFVALGMALALPDICGALEASNGRATGNRYANWVTRRLAPQAWTGEDLYHFRCSMIHQGSLQPGFRIHRLIFVERKLGQPIVHAGRIDASHFGVSATIIDVPEFVGFMVAAVRLWLEEVQETEPFNRNFLRSVHRHPDGIHPFIAGCAVYG